MTNRPLQLDAPLKIADAGGLLRGLVIAAPLSGGLWAAIAALVHWLATA